MNRTKPFRSVYFAETGVASIVTVLDDNTEIEVATVGYEGMVGLPVFLGANKSTEKAFWQVDGRAFVLDAGPQFVMCHSLSALPCANR